MGAGFPSGTGQRVSYDLAPGSERSGRSTRIRDSRATHINPFSSTTIDAKNTFVSGPLTADSHGNIYYNVIMLSDPATAEPWFGADVQGAWLVKVTPQDVASIASYASLVPGAPVANSVTCLGRFTGSVTLPWPPTPTAIPLAVLWDRKGRRST